MEKYEPLGVVGEGSYGVVLKCRNRESGRSVAIKKFIDSEDDQNVRKIALREIRVLRKLRHENLVNLLEVFRRRKHLYLVFEFIDHTLLDEMENKGHGLEGELCRKYVYQIIRGLGFCHDNNIIHRDVKPENVLVSKNGIVKLCDFGFARNLCGPGEQYTDYVATRWYRAPELLVGDVAYGKEVDIWAVGCLFSEMMSGEPLFPGDSDIDQLFLIAQCLGRLARRHVSIMSRNSAFRGFQFPKSRQGSTASSDSQQMGKAKLAKLDTLRNGGQRASGGRKKSSSRLTSTTTLVDKSVFSEMFPSWNDDAVIFLTLCLDPEPEGRPGCNALLRVPYFTHDSFPSRFINELNLKLQLEGRNPIPAYSTRKKRSILGTGVGSVANVTSSSGSGGGPPSLYLKKNNPLYQTRGNLNSIISNEPAPFSSSGNGNTMKELNLKSSSSSENLPPKHLGLVRDQTFLVSKNHAPAPTSGFQQRKGSYAALSSNLLNSQNSSAEDSKIPTLSLSRKYSDDSLMKGSGAGAGNFNSNSKSNPNINSNDDSLNSNSNIPPLFTTVQKRFSIPPPTQTSHGVADSKIPTGGRKFSYSFPPPASQPALETPSEEKEKLFHTLPVTTLTFSLGPSVSSTATASVSVKSPNFQYQSGNSNLYTQQHSHTYKSTPSPTKLQNSTYFPQTQNFTSNSNANANSRTPAVSFYPGNSKSLPVSIFGVGVNKQPEVIGTAGDGFLPRMMGRNFTPSGNSIKEDAGSGGGENFTRNSGGATKPGTSSLNRNSKRDNNNVNSKWDQQTSTTTSFMNKGNGSKIILSKHLNGGGEAGNNFSGGSRHFSTYGTQ